MTRHDDTVALRHMRDHALEAVAAARGRSRQDLDGDRMFALALIKLVEIVGEAAGRVSLATRSVEPRIPWNEIVAVRNRLAHGYDPHCTLLSIPWFGRRCFLGGVRARSRGLDLTAWARR